MLTSIGRANNPVRLVPVAEYSIGDLRPPRACGSEEGDVGKISVSANQALVDQLKELHVRGVLTQMAERGQLLELKC